MKKRILIYFLTFFSVLTYAQSSQYVVADELRLDETSIQAKRDKRTDINDRTCALIIIVKQGVNGLKFSLRGVAPCDMQEKETEYFLWVPPNTRTIYFKHPDLGNLEYTIAPIIKSGSTYRMALRSNVDKKVIFTKKKPEQVTLVMDPPEARVAIKDANSGDVIMAEKKADEKGEIGKLLRPGRYTVSISAPRYESKEAELLVLEDGSRVFHYSLVPNFAEVTFNTQPEGGATILINGRPEPVKTPSTVRVNPGNTNITIELEDFKTVSIDTLIQRQTEYIFNIVMESTVSRSTIVTDPQAKILLDGVQLAMGSFSGKIDEGQHQILIQREGFIPLDTMVTLKAGSNFTLNKKLKPRIGSLLVESSPNGSDVYVDGRLYGQTPIPIDLQIGSHEVKVSKTGYAPYVSQVVIKENKEVNLSPTLSESMDIIINSNPTGAAIYINGVYSGSTPYTYVPLGASENLRIRLTQSGYNDKSIDQSFNAGQSYTFDLEKESVSQKVDKILEANTYRDFYDGRSDMDLNYFVSDNYGLELLTTRYEGYVHYSIPFTNVAFRSIGVETNRSEFGVPDIIEDQELYSLSTSGVFGFNYGFGNEDLMLNLDLDAYFYGGYYFAGGDMSFVEPLNSSATHYGYGVAAALKLNFGSSFYVKARTALYAYDNLLDNGLYFAESDVSPDYTSVTTGNTTSAPLFTVGIGFNLTEPYDNSLYESFGSTNSYDGYWGFMFGTAPYESLKLGMFFKNYFGGGFYGNLQYVYDYSSIPAYSIDDGRDENDDLYSASFYNDIIDSYKENGVKATTTIEYSALTFLEYELGYSFGFYESGSTCLLFEVGLDAAFGMTFFDDGVGYLTDGEDLFGLGFKYNIGIRPRLVFLLDGEMGLFIEYSALEYDNSLNDQLFQIANGSSTSRNVLVTDPDITHVPWVTFGFMFSY